MEPHNIFLEQIDSERNIYEPATLFQQNRVPVETYVNDLRAPGSTSGLLEITGNKLLCKESGKSFDIENEVANFITPTEEKLSNSEWERLNTQFLNYHRSLTVYTLLNSLPVLNYLAAKSGVADLKDIKLVDIGGGTGHAFCSFFKYPENIDYYLIDPNLRLLHDQFIRLYPKLLSLKLKHILAYAEELPLKSELADVVMSLSAVDHFKDYKMFIAESFRVLKPGGLFFLSSHLEIPVAKTDALPLWKKLLSPAFPERFVRYLYYRKHLTGRDDHTYHFTSTAQLEQAIKEQGFIIEKCEVFKRYFFITARKLN